MNEIYLDHASTTALLPEVLEAMRPYFSTQFGHASALHSRGTRARQALDEARAAVAALLPAEPDEMVFTGSATEANNLAIKGLAWSVGRRGGHFVAAATEHISVLHPLRTLQKQGFEVTLLPVDRNGLVDPDDVRRAVRPDTLLVSVAHANAEIGTTQPLADLCRAARGAGALFHTDAALTAGAIPLPRGDDRPDLVTLTPHLFYGPQGIGALRVRRGVRLAPLVEGGAQEAGRRAGTEALAVAVGFGAAARLAAGEMEARGRRSAARAGALQRRLSETLDGVVMTGHPTRRVPGLLSLCLRGIEAESLLTALDAEGVEAASGSACTTAVRKPSHVLQAIGLDPVLARGAVTFAFGEANGDGDAAEVARLLPPLVERLRRLSPLA
jgi:cysteine desulfurase